MSNSKKKPNKKPVQAKKAAEKKPVNKKAFIIACGAVLAVAVIVLLAVFVIKPAIENGNKNDDTTTTAALSDEYVTEVNTELVDYNGLKLEKTYADFLIANESKRVSKCSQYSCVVEIGKTKISLPEFSMYYYTKFLNKYSDVQQSISSNGTNLTGYDVEKMPDEQKYIMGDGTWATRFSYEAVQDIQSVYVDFQRACAAGTELTQEDAEIIEYSYKKIVEGAKRNGKTVDDHMADSYVQGVDLDMFMARVIMMTYAKKYAADEKQRLEDACTQAEMEEKRAENPMIYKVAKVRVYMTASEFTQEEVDAVRSIADFNAFVKNNHPNEEYNVEGMTNLGYMSYSELEALHGETVANWAFDSKRLKGEIDIVSDYLGKYLVLVEEPAFDPGNYQLIVYLNTTETAKTDAAKFYERWSSGEKTEESFRELANNSSYCQEGKVRIIDYDFEVAEWVSDPARKNGDVLQLDLENASYVAYFIKANDEPDWMGEVRTELAEAVYEQEYNSLTENAYKETVNDDASNDCISKVNVKIKKFLATQED